MTHVYHMSVFLLGSNPGTAIALPRNASVAPLGVLAWPVFPLRATEAGPVGAVVRR